MANDDGKKKQRHYDATADLLGGCFDAIHEEADRLRERRGTPDAEPGAELEFLRRVVDGALGR